ncbi:hypothetical protein G6F61_011802 [Rhizopus arrhizus]|nr:hypothetical protein G6F42_016379 [Rhizopus arrhizus]KAG1370714.1 hypothetical protein G6F61_011802 [Rhizopus arrhizus]
MLKDVRHLLLHICSSMTQARTNIALRSVNPSFSVKHDQDINYTVPLEGFQQSLIQQTSARKATRDAMLDLRHKCRFPSATSGSFSSSSSFDPSTDQQFFRTGPSSQQGGLNNNIYQQQQQLQSQQQQQQTEQQEEHQPFSSVISPLQIHPVGNRLSKFYSKWTDISNNSYINTIIQHGYHIPFHITPPVTTSPTLIIPYSTDQIVLLDKAIQELLTKAAIEKVFPQQVSQVPGFYSSIFVIPKKNGGIRPVFNLKKLNLYLDAPHFKMETIREVSRMIKPNDYLTSIDLSDAFLHMGLHPSSRRYLRFQWRNQVYQFCTTAFGLSTSPYSDSQKCPNVL